jgi:uncharacterized protein
VTPRFGTSPPNEGPSHIDLAPSRHGATRALVGGAMIEALAAIAAGATLGLASVPHCVGMCGGIAGACSRSRASSVTYQVSRAATYTALGGAAALALGPVRGALPSGAWALLFAAVTASALVFSAVRLLRMKKVDPSLVPVTALRRETRRDRWMPLGLGVVTGLLPCGALYGALAVAAATGEPALGAMSMAAFAGASSVGLVVAHPVTRFLARDGMRHGRAVVATALLVGAAIVLVRPFMGPSDAASCHASLPHHAAPSLVAEAAR